MDYSEVFWCVKTEVLTLTLTIATNPIPVLKTLTLTLIVSKQHHYPISLSPNPILSSKPLYKP
jgi:hypothetical protein